MGPVAGSVAALLAEVRPQSFADFPTRWSRRVHEHLHLEEGWKRYACYCSSVQSCCCYCSGDDCSCYGNEKSRLGCRHAGDMRGSRLGVASQLCRLQSTACSAWGIPPERGLLYIKSQYTEKADRRVLCAENTDYGCILHETETLDNTC